MKALRFKIIKSGGFTLIETIVAIFAFAIIMLGLVALVSQMYTGSQNQSGLLADTDQARKTAFNLVNELRNAQSSSGGAFALDTAGDQNLIFYSKNPSGKVDRLRYYLQNGALYRGVIQYDGSGYPPAAEATALVQRNVANGAQPLFYYYDGDYTGSSTQTSLAQPVNVTAVKYVKLNLRIFNKAGVANTNTYTITAGGTVRSLKTNLGD